MSRAGNVGGGVSQAQLNAAIAALGTPLIEQARTNGFALQNGTPTILSWTAPNDGNVHIAAVAATLGVTVAETGGAIQAAFTTNGTGQGLALFPGGAGIGTSFLTGVGLFLVDPNTTVRINQTTALTAGAASLLAIILGL